MADFYADKMDFYDITDQERKELHDAMNSGGIAALEPYLRQKMDEWRKVPLNIGIIGNSGGGKSSFINAIRGLTADDDGAAPTGVTETTLEPKDYSHPKNINLKFWDLPGVGTPMFPKETYLLNIDVGRFDFFLIMSSNRFTENDSWLGKQISENGKKFFFVRTKTNIDIMNDKDDHPKTHDRDALLIKIRENIEKNLDNLYKANMIFLIDNHRKSEYQFKELEQEVIDNFPKVKQHALVLSMTVLSEEMIKKKVNHLRSTIWKAIALSVTYSTITALVGSPFALIAPLNVRSIRQMSIKADFATILNESRFYFKQLGLDEESLKKTAQQTSSDLKHLQEEVNKNLSFREINLDDMARFLSQVPEFTGNVAVKYPSSILADIGSRFLPPDLFNTRAALNYILTKMEEAALAVVKVAAEGDSVKFKG